MGYRIQCFPGINAYVEKRFSQSSGGAYIPNLIRLDYPIRKLYGEPMLPIYDYNTDSQIENSFGINFDTEANIYNFRYFKALYQRFMIIYKKAVPLNRFLCYFLFG